MVTAGGKYLCVRAREYIGKYDSDKSCHATPPATHASRAHLNLPSTSAKERHR